MIEDNLKEILRNVRPNVNLEDVTPDTSLIADLGIDSISMIMLALAIENTFNIKIDSSVRFEKVRDVMDYIASATGSEK